PLAAAPDHRLGVELEPDALDDRLRLVLVARGEEYEGDVDGVAQGLARLLDGAADGGGRVVVVIDGGVEAHGLGLVAQVSYCCRCCANRQRVRGTVTAWWRGRTGGAPRGVQVISYSGEGAGAGTTGKAGPRRRRRRHQRQAARAEGKA